MNIDVASQNNLYIIFPYLLLLKVLTMELPKQEIPKRKGLLVEYCYSATAKGLAEELNFFGERHNVRATQTHVVIDTEGLPQFYAYVWYER